jgi:hypothetical protein
VNEAERRGEHGRALPLREICAHEGVTMRAPVLDGGRDERLAYYYIKVCF